MFGDILWRNKTSFSLAFCVSVSVICLVWQGNLLSRGIGTVGKLSDRVSSALNSTMKFTGTIWVELDRYRELEKRYAQAQKTLKAYRLEKDKFDFLRKENDRLRKQVGFSARLTHKEVDAEVLGIRLNSISPRIIIDKGTNDGVQIYMPVIARSHDKEQNLIRTAVGIVVAADANVSIVQPLTHAAFRMGVRMPVTGQWAILSGNSGSVTNALLTYIASDAAADGTTISRFDAGVKPGTHVVTSGGSGIFPPGIPVGTLLKEGPRSGEFRTALVRPYASIPNLDQVTIVLKKPQPWSQLAKRKARTIQDHLKTPFGQPPMPNVDLRKTKKTPATTTKPVAKPTRKEDPGASGRQLRNLKGP